MTSFAESARGVSGLPTFGKAMTRMPNWTIRTRMRVRRGRCMVAMGAVLLGEGGFCVQSPRDL